MLSEKTFYDLSLLSYFNAKHTGISVKTLIEDILQDEELARQMEKDITFPLNKALLEKIDTTEYADMLVKEFVDDNAASGVVYYIFSCEEGDIFAFRGSEALDDIHHSTGWQDWTDNFHMFLNGPTYQQLYSLHEVQKRELTSPFYFCGHSKGGNLALFIALTMRQNLLPYLQKVVSFNAPGITRSILEVYDQRSKDPELLRKLLIFENENDCISSFFENLRTPIYVKSCMSCNNMLQLYHNHNLYAMNFEKNQYILAEKKTAIPKIVYHFVNDFFVNLKEERLKSVVAGMDDYFNSSLSMNELYKVLLYHISQYTNLFEDISYDEIQTITFQDLIDRRKTKNLLGKVKNKASQTINEFDIKEVTQGIIDNYEALKDTTIPVLQELLNRNNERITNAISSIRNRKEDKAEKEELQTN